MPDFGRDPRRARAFRALLLVPVLAVACAEEHSVAPAPVASARTAGPGVPVADAVRSALAAGDSARVLVLLDPGGTTGAVGVTAGSAVAADGGALPPPSAIADVQADVLSSLPDGVLANVHTYAHFPMFYAELSDLAALDALTGHPAVVQVFDDRENTASLAESLPLVRQPEAAQTGALGAGTTVAVLDTGTDYTRGAFGACSAPGVPGCRVRAARDFAPDDGSRDDNGHGTNVAGIVAGVAPGAGIVALDVFTGASAYSNVILQAVDWLIANRATYNVVAMNLSLGGGSSAGPCDNDVFATGLQAARAAGILPVVASGNNGTSAAIASPACVPAALAVGAVYDANIGGLSFPGVPCADTSTQADKVTCFSNASPQLALLAPGSSISAAGYTMSGTSQACPHVAGAVAVLASALPAAGTEDIVRRLTSSGPLITDTRNGLARRRLDVMAALGADLAVPAPAPAADREGPVGKLTLAGGADATNTRAFSVRLEATDATGVASMCLSSARSCTTFVPYAASSTYTVPAGDGLKTVFAYLRDTLGNVSGPFVDALTLDTARPSDGSLTGTTADASVRLVMKGATDSVAGPLTYLVVKADGTRAPANCSVGTNVYTGAESSTTISGQTNGMTASYRMCVRDVAGNVSAGVTFTGRPAPEYAAPTGRVLIAAGAEWTATRQVTLDISAQDASGVATMCISTNTGCTAYVPFAARPTVTLAAASGVAQVYVFLMDVWGNVTTTPLTDTINVDSAAPAISALTGTQMGVGRMVINWTGTDVPGIGVARYTLVYTAGGTPPASCTQGTVLYSGDLTAFVQSGLAVGKHAYRLCAVDRLGNTFAGRTVITTVR